jgi:DNA polymerase I
MDKLIYGKNSTDNIVSIEVIDDIVELHRLTDSGDIEIEYHPNRFWILSPRQLNSSWVPLQGNLYYRYGKQFKSREEYLKNRNFLRKNDIYSIYDPKEACMVKDGFTYYKGLKPKDIPILTFDLETTGLNPANADAQILLISNTFRKNGKCIKRLFAYDEYSSEGEMIEEWAKWVREVDPCILAGHNINCFDIPYLEHRASVFGLTVDLGRDGSGIEIERNFESKLRIDGSRDLHYHRIKCYGREIIDTMFLAYKHDIAAKKYDSYGLKPIIKVEKLEDPNRQFYDAGQIRFKYKDPVEWAKIKSYCIDDSDDALKLFDLMSPAFFYMTQSIPRSFQQVVESASGSWINGMMMRSYLQDKHSLPKADQSADFEGAISLGNPGIYRNVRKVDVASLYPSIILQYRVFDDAKDPKEYFLKLVETFTNLRLEYKKKAKEDKYFDDLQGAFKILINSAYGFMGTSGLLFNSPKKAAFVTTKGREILQKCIDWASDKKYVLVNADTDSISYAKSDQTVFTKEELDGDLKDINSLYPARIRWEDDGYYKCIIVIKAKNYVLQTPDGKVKTKGSALKATTKEPALREFIAKTIQMMLSGEDPENMRSLYESYVKEIMSVTDIKRWVSRKTISDKVLNAERANEQKVKDIIEDTEYVEGDRVYVFFLPDGTLELAENFKGTYDKAKLLEKLYKTAVVFTSVLPVKDMYANYSLASYFNKLDPEQALIKKQLAAKKRKEALQRKAEREDTLQLDESVIY